MKTHNERVTDATEEPLVVFLIGMRVNRWWKVRQWLRTALAMPRMLRELGQHPQLGMLGGEAWFGRTTILVSYWKSVDHLFGYAKQPNLAGLEERQIGAVAQHAGRDMSADHTGYGVAAAFVRHMEPLDPGHLAEHLANHVLRAAGAR